jgi:serine protease
MNRKNMARYLLLLFIPLVIYGFYPQGDVAVIKNGDIYYLSNTVVVKPSAGINFTDGIGSLPVNISSILQQYGWVSSKQLFSGLKESGRDLERIMILSFQSPVDPHIIASALTSTKGVEWAEPKFVYEIVFIPNDPSYGSQWGLPRINAPAAWDVTQGDTSVVIAINDTGVDWDHPDLSANIWRNWGEIPNNGIDDDGNGYIDDIRGWDFGGLNGTPDNDPMEDRPDHGTHVAGIASAVTDNAVGIASIGFKTKIMPVKTSRDDVRNPQGIALISYGYEGIVYAADNGAKVINTSWGGSGFSILGQEVINYATLNGALIVGAAGNSNSSAPFYPASYDGVLSVASTEQSDLKSGFSNYGTGVDVSAPGGGILSTWQNNTYSTASGTSMAAPFAAGLVGLTAAVFPSYNPIQLGEQVRVNTDNIDALNPSFQFLLGSGRLNAFKSVSNMSSVSARALNITFSDESPGGNGNGILEAGETISVRVGFMNYLNPTSGLNVTIETRNPHSVITNASFNAGAVGTLQGFDNNSSPFTFTLNSSIPANADLVFLLKYNDGAYSDYQWVRTIGNPTYATQSGNDVSLTITSKGTLGFNDYPNNSQGEGFKYNGSANLLFEGALMLGTSAVKISDAARSANQGVQSNDFQVVQPFVISVPGNTSDYQGLAVFNDDNAGSNKIGVTVNLNSYSYVAENYKNFIILRYSLINNGSTEINNLYAGLYFDWDIIDGSGDGDITNYDSNLNYGYVYNSIGGPDIRIATALVSDGPYGFYAIKNDGTDGGIGVYDGFTDAEKWTTLSGGLAKLTAGPADISNVISGGPYNIAPGASADAAFIIAAGETQSMLDNAVMHGRNLYQIILTDIFEDENNIPLQFNLAQNYPNPFNPETIIRYSIPEDGFVSLKIYDITGREAVILVNKDQRKGEYSISFKPETLASGVYLYRITSGGRSAVRKMIYLK